MNKLAVNAKADEIIRQYHLAKTQIQAAYETLKEQQERLRNLTGDEHINIMNGFYDIMDCCEKSLKKTERRIWDKLIDKLGIRKILSIKKLDELNQQIRDGEVLELTIENVWGTIDSLTSQAATYAEEAIKEVYDFLRPKDSYKTNSEFIVEKKSILKSVLSSHYSGGGMTLGYSSWARDRIRALDKVFHLLDGAAFLSANCYQSPLIDMIEKADEGKTKYFKFRCFRNGNLHIWYLRDDLVKELNRVAGGGNLMP